MNQRFYSGLSYVVVFLLTGITPGIFYSRVIDPFELPKFLFIRLVLCLFFIFALFYKKNSKINYSKIFMYIGLFGVSVSISTLLSEYRDVSFYGEWERYLGLSSMLPIILSAVPLLFIDRKRLPIIKYAFVLGIILVIVKGFKQILGYDMFSLENLGGRIISSLGNADFLGEYIVMVMPIVMLEAIYSRYILERIIFFILFGLTFYILLTSGTRSSWLAFLLLLVLMPIVFLRPKTPYFVYKKVVFYLVFTGGVILMVLYLPTTVIMKLVLFLLLMLWLYLYLKYLLPYIKEMIAPYKRRIMALTLIMVIIYIAFPYTERIIPHRGAILTDTIKARLRAMAEPEMGRFYILRTSFRYIKSEMIRNPARLFFGCGLDTTGKYLSRYKVIESARRDPIDNVIYADRAHNEYVDILLQTGLVSFFIFILLLFNTIKTGIDIHRSRHPFRIFTTAVTLGIVGFAINGVFIFGVSVIYLYLFLMCGIIGVINSKRLRLEKRGIYSILVIFALIFFLYSSYSGIRQIRAHHLLLDGINTMNRGDLVNAERLLDASIESYPVGYAFQKKLELYSIKLREEKKREIFEAGEKLFPDILRHVKYPTSAYYSISRFYMDGYDLGLDKSFLDKVIENLKICLDYDRYYKPALKALAMIYIGYLKDPGLAYIYAKRFVDIEQRDIEMWKILMRTAKIVKDWNTVWFSAKAIYLATEGKDKEAERYLKEAERFISPSKTP
ncbi:O-antigen ligase family protein [bacterium]|nr:O-antigen ligase family protein [bacterium]